MAETRIEFVLFDLGGVLVELGGIHHWKELTSQMDDDEIWRNWLSCPVVRAYETGKCSTGDFASGMVERHDLDVSAEEFIEAFAGWPKGLYPESNDVVLDVVDHVQVGCFSNTNELHWAGQNEWNHIQSLFDLHFLSFEMGHAKPDKAAFEHVTESLGCDPAAIFFVDDNIINVEGARECGLNAHVTKGPVDARNILSEHGLMKSVSPVTTY